MTGRFTQKPGRGSTVRFDGFEDMPAAEPLGDAFKTMGDADVERRAAADPDAGSIPAGFWDAADLVLPKSKEQITLPLDADVLRHFRKSGKGYQSRINAVLRSYVQAQEKRR